MPSRSVTPSAADYDEKPYSEQHRFRGRVYTLTELPIAEYDRLVQAATVKDAETGIERQDDIALMKLLFLGTVDVSPREYAKLGARVVLTMNRHVRMLYFTEEPDELKDVPADSEEPEAEGDSPGNDHAASAPAR